MSVEVTVSSTGAAIARAPKVMTIIEVVFILSDVWCVEFWVSRVLESTMACIEDVETEVLLCQTKQECFDGEPSIFRTLKGVKSADSKADGDYALVSRVMIVETRYYGLKAWKQHEVDSHRPLERLLTTSLRQRSC